MTKFRIMAHLVLCTLFVTAGHAGEGATRVNKVLTELKKPKQGEAAQRFELSEADLNDFALAAIQSKKRLGVKQVVVDLRSGAMIESTALVNMDEVELTGFTARMAKSLLSGTQTLKVLAKLSVENGEGSFEIQSAGMNGISVPVWIVNLVVSYLSKRQPPHIDITEPFNPPYGIKDMRVTANRVVIVR
ncbi:hypothetical protein MYX84_13675 [Acidobacteria bacterium AH-259-O06]|nr:hypothetical protein [Acidobacteria bacterium AH-259-O06]